MSQTVNVFYKSVILSQGHKETLEYHGQGVLSQHGLYYHLDFKADQHHFQIDYKDDEVILKNHQQVLNLHRHQIKDNDYPTDFGILHLKTKLLKLDGHQDHLHLVYELYDQTTLLSKIFMKIHYIPVHEEAV